MQILIITTIVIITIFIIIFIVVLAISISFLLMLSSNYERLGRTLFKVVKKNTKTISVMQLVSLMGTLNNVYLSIFPFDNPFLKLYCYILPLTISSFIFKYFLIQFYDFAVILTVDCKMVFDFTLTKPLKKKIIICYFKEIVFILLIYMLYIYILYMYIYIYIYINNILYILYMNIYIYYIYR